MKKVIGVFIILCLIATISACGKEAYPKQTPVAFKEEGRVCPDIYAPIFNEYSTFFRCHAVLKGTIGNVQEYRSEQIREVEGYPPFIKDNFHTLFEFTIDDIFHSEDDSLSVGKIIIVETAVSSNRLYIDRQYPHENSEAIIFLGNLDLIQEQTPSRTADINKEIMGENYTPYRIGSEWTGLIRITDDEYIFHSALSYLINEDTIYLYSPTFAECDEIGMVPYFGNYCVRKDENLESDLLKFIDNAINNLPPREKIPSGSLGYYKYLRLGGQPYDKSED